VLLRIDAVPKSLARLGESATLCSVAMNVFRLGVLLFAFGVVASFAEETNTLPTTITVDGITYSNVTWRTVTPATVSIFHETGVASIPLEKLSPELQKRFGYDPQKAADYVAQGVAATQAQELLRQKRQADALAVARKQQEALAEQAKAQAKVQAAEQLKANQKANANIETIQVLHIVGGIMPLDTGGYTAQISISNQTAQIISVCAHFDEGGMRYLQDASRKFAQWKAREDAMEQQVQLQGQSLTLYGGHGSVKVNSPGWMPGNGPSSIGPPPVAPVFALHEGSVCYILKGSHEVTSVEGLKNYSW
jgi:hypothetical protein